MNGRSPMIQVFMKEMREIARDKRVRTTAIVMPLVVIALMISLFGTIASSVGGKAKKKVFVVATTNPLLKQLKSNPGLDVNSVSTADAGRKLIRDGKARLVVELQAGKGDQTNVDFLFDPKEDMSEVSKSAVKQALEPFRLSVETSVLAAKGLTKEQLEPIVYKDVPVTVGEGTGAGSFLVGFVPYLLVLFTFTGGMSFAGDLVAGEKEKSTLETLLISPVPRTQIVLGKFLALMVVCLTSALSGIMGLAAASVLHLPGSDFMFRGGFGLTPKSVLVLLALLLPLVAFFAALLVAVSTYAKNSREAQTYLSIVNLLVIIPAVFSQVLGFTEFGSSTWINFIPVLNTAANLRADLQGKPTFTPILETVLLGIVMAAIMIKVAVDLFNKEQVLIRT